MIDQDLQPHLLSDQNPPSPPLASGPAAPRPSADFLRHSQALSLQTRLTPPEQMRSVLESGGCRFSHW